MPSILKETSVALRLFAFAADFVRDVKAEACGACFFRPIFMYIFYHISIPNAIIANDRPRIPQALSAGRNTSSAKLFRIATNPDSF